jgi:hypothetical protein
MMLVDPDSALRSAALTGLEAVLTGLLAGGCRLAFAPPGAYAVRGDDLRRFARQMNRAGGALVQAQSEHAAVAMAAGAALAGARSVALVTDVARADCALTGLDDLAPILVDVGGRLALNTTHMRVVVAPHTAQAALEAGAGLFGRAGALHGPALIAGLEAGREPVHLEPPENGGPVPIHHHGPDDAELLLVGAGPGFAACAEARDRLEEEGLAAAHLHLVQLHPFPGAIVAPALTSARRILVVEPGGPGTLAGLIRCHLGSPAAPFGELPRLAGAALSADAVHIRAREVMAL